MTPGLSVDPPSIDMAALVEILPQPSLVLAPDLTLLAVSGAFPHTSVSPRQDLLGLSLFDLLMGDPQRSVHDIDKIRASIAIVLASRRRHDVQVQSYGLGPADPRTLPAEDRIWTIRTQPVFGPSGQISCLVQSIELSPDPAHKAQAAEARFRTAEERFEATFEQHAVGIAHIAPDGHLLQINRRFGELLGYSTQEMLGKTIQDITHPDDRLVSMRQAKALISGSVPHYTIDKRYIRKDGSLLWVSSTRSLVRTPAGEPAYIVAVVEDISARKAAEAAVRNREAHLRSILETVPDGMIVIDQAGMIESISRTAEKLFGYAAEDVIGRNVGMLMSAGDRQRHDGYIQSYLETQVPRIIGRGRVVTGERKDGSVFALNLSVGEISTTEKRQFVGFVQDLTESQAAEARLRELQAELVHVSRFTALGEMASALAHELNQPLTAIANYLKGCRRLIDQGIDGRGRMLSEAVDAAAEQALRAGQIIRRLRDFVARGESERSIESLPKLIEEASVLALVGARENGVRVSCAYDPKAQFVYADRIQIQQVLMNLIRNAIEAMQESVQRDLSIATAARPEGMVEISVCDSGTGLAPEIAPHLFQPFMTTKTTGLGVGLSICRTIIEAHEGKIAAASNPTGGTIFSFTLPGSGDRDEAYGA